MADLVPTVPTHRSDNSCRYDGLMAAVRRSSKTRILANFAKA